MWVTLKDSLRLKLHLWQNRTDFLQPAWEYFITCYNIFCLDCADINHRNIQHKRSRFNWVKISRENEEEAGVSRRDVSLLLKEEEKKNPFEDTYWIKWSNAWNPTVESGLHWKQIKSCLWCPSSIERNITKTVGRIQTKNLSNPFLWKA